MPRRCRKVRSGPRERTSRQALSIIYRLINKRVLHYGDRATLFRRRGRIYLRLGAVAPIPSSTHNDLHRSSPRFALGIWSNKANRTRYISVRENTLSIALEIIDARAESRACEIFSPYHTFSGPSCREKKKEPKTKHKRPIYEARSGSLLFITCKIHSQLLPNLSCTKRDDHYLEKKNC